jgi:hypothetical protein
MKNKITLLLLLVGLSLNAQIKKLSDLSKNKFLDSKIIYEDNGEDIYGYFLLYENDKKNRDVFELEYVLLDKNLNVLSSNTFLQSHFNTVFAKLKVGLMYAEKHKDILYLSICDISVGQEEMYEELGLTTYRTLNLKDFTVSEQKYMQDFVAVKMEKENIERKDLRQTRLMHETKNKGFLVSDEDFKERVKQVYFGTTNFLPTSEIHFFDMDLNEKWVYKYNKDKEAKTAIFYEYLTGDKNDMIFKKFFYTKKKHSDAVLTYQIIDSETGKDTGEIKIEIPERAYEVRKVLFEDDKVIFYVAVSDLKKGKFDFEKIRGYSKLTFNRTTGKQMNRSDFKWGDLVGKLDMDEYGEVKSYGFLHFLDFKRTKDGKTVVFGEGYKNSGNTTELRDMHMLVFDDAMKIIDYQKIDKVKKKSHNFEARRPLTLQKYGVFGYVYSQNLPGNGFAFCYTEKVKDKDWRLGIVTYADEKISLQSVPIKSEKWHTNFIKAKNGYILFHEHSDSDSELRLEKIDY